MEDRIKEQIDFVLSKIQFLEPSTDKDKRFVYLVSKKVMTTCRLLNSVDVLWLNKIYKGMCHE